MPVSVDCVMSTMLESGGDVIIRYVSRIATHLDIPQHVSSPWFRAHHLLGLGTHDLFKNILETWVVQNEEEANIGRLTKIMEDMQLISVSESISELGNSETPIIHSSTRKPHISGFTHVTNSNANSFSFGVKPPIHQFVGRAIVLKELNDHFICHTQKCVVIYGIGGQGKTELCKKFIHDLITANSSHPAVVWLPGENVHELTSRVSKLAHRLPISTHDEAGKPFPLLQLFKNIAKHIKNFSSPRWLVVVDNIDEIYPELKKMIQILIDYQAFVLITSRRNDIFPGAVTPLKLETLAQSDAMLLVKTSLKNTTHDDATLLCNKIGNHALALQQSLAYIRMQAQISTIGYAYGISHFLQEFQESQKTILQHPVELVNYDHTIHAIVRTTLDSISTKYGKVGKMTRELGIILGLVNPDGIRFNTLQKLHNIYTENRSKPMQFKFIWPQWWLRLFGNGGQTAGHVPPPSTYAQSQLTRNDIREAVLLLAKFSMVSLNGEVVSIHRLVQMILRLECEYEQTINILLKHIQPKHHSVEELRQGISIWEHADPETVKIYPGFAIRIFSRMVDLSLILELSGFAEKNHTILSQLLGPNHEETLSMEYAIARAMDEKGDYETALTKLKTLHEKMKSVLEEDHPATLVTASLISIVLCRLNRNEEALEWREKELECRVKGHGENHTITSRSNKALILEHLGRVDEALSILQEVLGWREVKLGSFHPHTLFTRHNIALIRFRQEQFHEAMSELETVLKLREEVLGEEHVDTLTTKSLLARTNWELRRKEDAIRMMEGVLVSQEKVLGPNHPHTNMARNRLSNWIEKQRGDIPWN